MIKRKRDGSSEKVEPIEPVDPEAEAVKAKRVRRLDKRLERRAMVGGWATPEREKRTIITGLIGVFKGTTSDGKTAKLRSKLIAAKTLISADLRQQQLELEREIAAGIDQAGTLAELVGESEAIANALEISRQRGDAPGTGANDPIAGEVL